MNKWLSKQSVQRSIYGFLLLLLIVVFISGIRIGQDSYGINIVPRLFNCPLYVDYYAYYIGMFFILLSQLLRSDLIGWIVVAMRHLVFSINSLEIYYADRELFTAGYGFISFAITIGILVLFGYILYKIRPSRWI